MKKLDIWLFPIYWKQNKTKPGFDQGFKSAIITKISKENQLKVVTENSIL